MSNVVLVPGITRANSNSVAFSYIKSTNSEALISIGYFQTTPSGGTDTVLISYDNVNWLQHSSFANIPPSPTNPNGGVFAANGLLGVIGVRLYPGTPGGVLTLVVSESVTPIRTVSVGG